MTKQTVLVLCTNNAARSQMAEAFLKKYAGDRFEVYSAGLTPTEVHPLTARVMAEAGIDVGGQRAKDLRRFLGTLSVHHLITVCPRAEEHCPAIWPGALAFLSWPFEDPAACAGTEDEQLRKFREVRDQIRDRVCAWLEEQQT